MLLIAMRKFSFSRFLSFCGVWLMVVGSAGAVWADDKTTAHNYLIFTVSLVGREGNFANGTLMSRNSNDNYNETYSGVVEMILDDRSFVGFTDGDPTKPNFGQAWGPHQQGPVPLLVELSNYKRERFNGDGEGDSHAEETRLDTFVGEGKIDVSLDGPTLSLNSEAHTYSFQMQIHFPYQNNNPFVHHVFDRDIVGDPTLGGGTHENAQENIVLSKAQGLGARMAIKFDQLPLGDDITKISGSRKKDLDNGLSLVVEWKLVAVLPPLELKVTSDFYQTWRPSALPGPKAGQPLVFTARLRDPNGDLPKQKIKRIEWELIETSREPGIAMNFPLHSEGDKTPDLRFELMKGQTSTDPELQKMIEENPSNASSRARILPFDWGAWSVLRVRAYLDNVNFIEGKYVGQDGPIRIPRRAANSYIADRWKETHEGTAGAADKDDNEASDKNDHKGDGFSLYEEYRGWILGEKHEHEEGDPNKKDFFVLNKLGGNIAFEGLTLFSEATGMTVHSNLTEDEILVSADPLNPGAKDREMNANRSQAPRACDEPQHGVILANRHDLPFGVYGWVFLKEGATVWRPKSANLVAIDLKQLPPSGLVLRRNSSGELEPENMLKTAIAHELGHSIGAHHHGEIDPGWVFWLRKLDADGKVIGLVEQKVLRSYAKENRPSQIVLINHEPTPDSSTSVDIEVYSENEQSLLMDPRFSRPYLLFVGAASQGVLSGNADCIMRYFNAEAYVSHANVKRRYIIGNPEEHIGQSLCPDLKGTFTNEANPRHPPWPRFGNAAEGNCVGRISPRDNDP